MTSQDNNVYNLSDSRRSGKSKKRRVIRPGMKCLIGLAFFMLAYMMLSFGTNFNRLHSMQQDVEKIQSQIDELQKKNSDLRQQLKMAQSDAFVEKIAREELNLIKPGETRIVPVQTDSQKNGGQAEKKNTNSSDD
jgi:cell division protein FtsL